MLGNSPVRNGWLASTFPSLITPVDPTDARNVKFRGVGPEQVAYITLIASADPTGARNA
jgi:hypothetical protein